jgi:hypothetical protein
MVHRFFIAKSWFALALLLATYSTHTLAQSLDNDESLLSPPPKDFIQQILDEELKNPKPIINTPRELINSVLDGHNIDAANDL